MQQNKFPDFLRSKINWKIKNFTPQLLTDIRHFKTESPIFEVHFLHSFRELKLQFKLEKNRSCASIYLKLVDPENKLKSCYSVDFSVSLAGSYYSRKKCSTGKLAHLCFFYQRLGRVINFKEANTAHMTWNYLRNKTLNIEVRFDLVEILHTELNPVAITTQYEKLFRSDKFSDFQLITIDGTEIPVHKNILSIRSPVFEKMIESKMLESQENKVTVVDIGERAIIEFLHFIYCGTVVGMDELSEELLYASTKYDVPDLKPLCVQSLAQKLSKVNVFEILMLADLHVPDGRLKEFCIDFIKWNYHELKLHEGWKELPQSLYKDIIDDVLSHAGSQVSSTIESTIASAPTAAANPANPQ